MKVKSVANGASSEGGPGLKEEIEYDSVDLWRYDIDSHEVRFDAFIGEKNIPCRVERECIQDSLGNPDAQPDIILSVAKNEFDKITDRIGGLISSARFETDGSVLLRAADW
jgi:Protein of unknown function (DUF1488)